MKQFFGLILEDNDPVDSLLIDMIRAYEARKQPAKGITSDKSALYTTVVCPYCGRAFGYESRRGARIGMAAHYRQIHPDES